MIAVARGAQNPGNCGAIVDVTSRLFIVLQSSSFLRSPLLDLELPGCYGIHTFHLFCDVEYTDRYSNLDQMLYGGATVITKPKSFSGKKSSPLYYHFSN